MDSRQLDLETLKLLVSVAWADHEVAPREVGLLIDLLEYMGAEDSEVERVRELVLDEGQLPAPDMNLLREHREQVLRSVDTMMVIDDRVPTEEQTLRAAIETILR